MRILDGRAHLSYCSNIHPGESWAQTRANVVERVHAVKQRLAPDRPFGVGLRLSCAAADELLDRQGELARFADELDALGLYVFTLNGFPYGTFHGAPVKREVYRPDWRTPERLRYTLRLAEILARLLPADAGEDASGHNRQIDGTISTVPGGARHDTRDADSRRRIAMQLIAWAASAWRRVEDGGPVITLALEPEPACMLETTAEAVSFFAEWLLGRDGLAHMCALTKLAPAPAEQALRRHLGVCLDACHAAVEFESPRESVALLRAAGLRVAKCQVTTALRVAPVSEQAIAALRAFDDPIYLHQVVCRTADGLRRFDDLPEALAAWTHARFEADEWRVHYHVPVFMAELPPFHNTDASLRELLGALLDHDATTQLELETYTWSVLPEAHRDVDMSEAIVRELEWVLAQLEARR